jgi:hypothetical protein
VTIDWNVASTIATGAASVTLALFAAVQLYLLKQDRDDRRELAKTDRADHERTVVNALRAEQFRLLHLAQRWGQLDLVEKAKREELHFDDLRFPDWGTLTTFLGQAGPLACMLAMAAYGFVADASIQVRELEVAARRRLRADRGEGPTYWATPGQRAEWMAQWENEATRIEAEIKRRLTQAADGLYDAIRCAPRGREVVRIDIAALGLTSEIARRLAAGQQELSASPAREQPAAVADL